MCLTKFGFSTSILTYLANTIKHFFSTGLTYNGQSVDNFFLYVLGLALIVFVIQIIKRLCNINS